MSRKLKGGMKMMLRIGRKTMSRRWRRRTKGTGRRG
jgi:hypothetical protein